MPCLDVRALLQRPGRQHTQASCTATYAARQPSSNSAGFQASEAWQLMGRVVQEDRIVLSEQGRYQLVMAAAAREAKLEPQQFAQALQELVTLLPGLQPRLMGLPSVLLGRLAADTSCIANKLVQLRMWFPGANLTQLLDRRPSLLLDEEWGAVPAARQELLSMFGSQGSVDDLVTRQPLLLCEDVAGLVGELERLLPQLDARQALIVNPGLLDQVIGLRNLSIWLMPGVDVEVMLRSNPGVLYSVQRGSSSLGPGAEFVTRS